MKRWHIWIRCLMVAPALPAVSRSLSAQNEVIRKSLAEQLTYLSTKVYFTFLTARLLETTCKGNHQLQLAQRYKNIYNIYSYSFGPIFVKLVTLFQSEYLSFGQLLSCSRKKKTKEEEGELRTYFFEKKPGIFRFFTVSLEISDKTRLSPLETPQN